MNMQPLQGEFVDELMRKIVTQINTHDAPMHGSWLCGCCPYANSGPVCTKCGAPRYKGRAIG